MIVSDERVPQGFGSETPGLLDALLALQAELPKLPKDKTNPHFRSKFTGLDTIVETVGPLLAKHGLAWMTLPGRDELGPYLGYRLLHVASGQSEGGQVPLILAKDDMQGLGSALTYARRYALSCALNLVSDEDDDGHAASSYGHTSDAGYVNLQNEAKGLSTPALIAALKTADVVFDQPGVSVWQGMGRIPADKAEQMRAALQGAHNAEGR